MAKTDYKVLCAAIARQDLSDLKRQIRLFPDACRHWKPIVDACFSGQPKLVAVLLDAGADPNVVSGVSSRHTPLTRVCQHHSTIPKHSGHGAVLELLLRRGADPNLSAGPHNFLPIVYAAMAPSGEFVETLLKGGTDRSVNVDAVILDTAALKRRVGDDASIVHERDEVGRTALHFVAMSGMWKEHGIDTALECSSLLLPNGADVDAAQEIVEGDDIFHATALWWAIAWQENVELARHLLDRGADPNPPAFAATFQGNEEICELLHEFGTDWNQVHEGRTPLMDLLHWRRPKMTTWLLQHGADVGVTSTDGRTALHYAAYQGVKPEYVESLLNHGADPSATDAEGHTALDLAKQKNRTKVVAVLESAVG